MLNEEKWAKGWSNTVVPESHCYTEWEVTATCFKGLTDGILSQGHSCAAQLGIRFAFF